MMKVGFSIKFSSQLFHGPISKYAKKMIKIAGVSGEGGQSHPYRFWHGIIFNLLGKLSFNLNPTNICGPKMSKVDPQMFKISQRITKMDIN